MSARMRNRGVGLLEMLVALSVMALSLGMLYRSLGGSARGIAQVEAVQGAVLLGHSLLDGINMVEPQGSTLAGEEGIYSWQITSMPLPAPALASTVSNVVLHRVQLVIAWNGSSQWALETVRPQRPLLPIEVRP